jgi:hypothetical protein
LSYLWIVDGTALIQLLSICLQGGMFVAVELKGTLSALTVDVGLTFCNTAGNNCCPCTIATTGGVPSSATCSDGNAAFANLAFAGACTTVGLAIDLPLKVISATLDLGDVCRPPTPAPAPAPSPGGPNVATAVGVSIGALALVGAGSFFAIKRKNNNGLLSDGMDDSLMDNAHDERNPKQPRLNVVEGDDPTDSQRYPTMDE